MFWLLILPLFRILNSTILWSQPLTFTAPRDSPPIDVYSTAPTFSCCWITSITCFWWSSKSLIAYGVKYFGCVYKLWPYRLSKSSLESSIEHFYLQRKNSQNLLLKMNCTLFLITFSCLIKIYMLDKNGSHKYEALHKAEAILANIWWKATFISVVQFRYFIDSLLEGRKFLFLWLSWPCYWIFEFTSCPL